MAINLSASPFTSLSHDPYLFFKSLSPPHVLQLTLGPKEPLNFHLKFRPSRPSLHIANVSLEERESTAISEDSHNPDENPHSSSKSYIWVNQKSPVAAKLRQKSNDFRYYSLLKIAKSLDSCSAVEEDIVNVLESFGGKFVGQDVITVLNKMCNPENAILVFKYFKERLKFSEVILYNVTLKVFRKCRDFYGAEKLFDEMLERGVKPDNVTFFTIISCANMCSLPKKAVKLFERMPSYGCEPDDRTCSLMVDAYWTAGNVDKALGLYHRAKSNKWRLNVVTFTTVIKIYGTTGIFDECLNVYEEMKTLGIKPNLALYNNLLVAMGRAKRPVQAKSIYKEMLNNKIDPSWDTYAALLKAYCVARYGEDAVNLYREMKEKGMELTFALYNSLLFMCADVGHTDEAVEIFNDMKSNPTCMPDRWTYSAMLKIYSCSGKVEEAEAAMNEMLEAGFEPNVVIFTSLVHCYGKAGRIDDVVRTFDRLVELGVTPDERFCSCLLNIMAQAPKEELAKLMGCIGRANPNIDHLVKLLADDDKLEEIVLKKEASEFFDCIGTDVRKAYCNCLIDLCVNFNQLRRACWLFELGLTREIYTEIQSRTATQWSLHLKSLSPGAALTALHIWMNDLWRELKNGEELPSLLGINTGHGKHKFSEKGLTCIFEKHLKVLNAPFHEAPDKVGWFLTTNVAAASWLESRLSREGVAA